MRHHGLNPCFDSPAPDATKVVCILSVNGIDSSFTISDLAAVCMQVAPGYSFSDGAEPLPFEVAGCLTLEEIAMRSIPGRGKLLFRYRPNIELAKGKNYSHEELINGAIYLSTPKDFNDPFDSYPACNMERAALRLAQNYLEILGLDGPAVASMEDALAAVCSCFERFRDDNGRLDFRAIELDEMALLAFRLLTDQIIFSSGDSSMLTEKSLRNALIGRCEGEIETCANHMRIACFSSNINSNYMWAHYANNYQGFCIAYPFPGGTGVLLEDSYAWLSGVIYPVRYSLKRYDMTDSIADMAMGRFGKPEMDALFAKTYLSKGVEWFQEREWRLAVPRNDERIDEAGCVPFPKPAFVMAGCKMSDKEFAKLEEICSEREVLLVRTKESTSRFQVEVVEGLSD